MTSKEQDVIVYYSGHAAINPENKKVYLLPVDYHPNRGEAEATKVIYPLVQQKLWSAIACRAGNDADAMLTASAVASIVDATAGGGDYVYLQGDNGDAMMELAEELAYLDVEGPTLKARLVVDLTSLTTGDDDDSQAELVDECLMAGINKYVVEENRLQWLVDLVQAQGKTCNVDRKSLIKGGGL